MEQTLHTAAQRPGKTIPMGLRRGEAEHRHGDLPMTCASAPAIEGLQFHRPAAGAGFGWIKRSRKSPQPPQLQQALQRQQLGPNAGDTGKIITKPHRSREYRFSTYIKLNVAVSVLKKYMLNPTRVLENHDGAAEVFEIEGIGVIRPRGLRVDREYCRIMIGTPEDRGSDGWLCCVFGKNVTPSPGLSRRHQ